MVCEKCRNQQHEECPEVKRQADPKVSDLDKVASHLCYCAHRAPFVRQLTGIQEGHLGS